MVIVGNAGVSFDDYDVSSSLDLTGRIQPHMLLP